MKHIYTKIRNILLSILTLPLGGVGGGFSLGGVGGGFFLVVGGGLFSSCSEDTFSSVFGPEGSDIIQVGADAEGLVATSSVTTRAIGDGETKDAETVDWLVQPLKKGFDITYGKINGSTKSNERVAILKLKDDNKAAGKDYNVSSYGYAEYSFNYRGEDGTETTEPAVWYDNGYHYFEGVHVPDRLRYNGETNNIDQDNRSIQGASGLAAVVNLTTNQSNDKSTGTDNELGNYTLLAHYLGMPANTQIAATVARIKLPFRHRLAHVLAYILIDPSLMNGEAPTVIKGYKSTEAEKTAGKDDPNTSSIRFCNVDVLEGVHDDYDEDKKTHTLTPKWTKVRKAVPHFEKELETFKTYQSEEKTYYQGTTGFPATCPIGYEEVIYEKVPVYDLIVRPTYTSENNVMYDEDLTGTTKAAIANMTNQIDFTVSLDNGLTYEKNFVFDLDANYETIVYLKISREGVDYNESGSEKWVETEKSDDWYGVDNQNGHNLSDAGSSWQRAYYNTDLTYDDKITDGGFYDEDTSGEDGTKGQYVKTDTWQEYLLKAYQGGEHHGDYFVLANNITIDAGTLPSEGLIFTGHLDGYNTHVSRNYATITLLNAGSVVQCDDSKTDVLSKLYTDAEGTVSVPQLYWYKEIAQAPQRKTESIGRGEPILIDMSTTYPADLVTLEGQGKIILYKEGDEYKVYTTPTFYKKATAYLFAGLDGIYSTRQEDEETAGHAIYNQSWKWEANVHKEKGYWLPYRDVVGASATNTGWRAEVMNLTVIGGKLFKDDAVVTGFVQNCWEEASDGTKTKVTDHTPAYPKYK